MMTKSLIWVVDDDENNFNVIDACLSGEHYCLQSISSGEQVVSILDDQASLVRVLPDVILLDLMMPGINGIEVCQRLKTNPVWQSVPIIFITALDTKESLAQCFAAGADDFLRKPINRTELRARVRSMLRISSQYHAILDLNQKLNISNLQLSNLNHSLEAQVQERTADLEWTLYHDGLTQLPNRLFLLRVIKNLLDRHPQIHPGQFTLFYLGCDRFQVVNDSLGYAVGDRILQEIANRLQNLMHSQDVLTRIGTDEFCLLTHRTLAPEELELLANQILEQFQTPFEIDQYKVFLTACLGIDKAHGAYRQPDEPLRNANTALHRAKSIAPSSYLIFQPSMQRSTVKRLQLENDLRQALKDDSFIVFYQPILNLQDRKTIALEALVRLDHPQRGLVAPGEFIGCAEDCGLIIPLGLQVLRKACLQLHTWITAGHEGLTISVNLSTRQLADPMLLENIDQILAEVGLDPSCLQLEITESYLIENHKVAIAMIHELRSRHIQISLDDFGTGYSSLGYLTQFPVSSLKLDRCFIQNVCTSVQDREIVKAVIAMGQALGIQVTAEGVETEPQMRQLIEIDCDYAQGYYFSRPLRAEKATAWLEKH